MDLTLDSSVVVEYVLEDVNYELCRDLLNKAFTDSDVHFHQPSIFLFEFVTAVNRGSKEIKDKNLRTKRALDICELFIGRKNTFFYPLGLAEWKNWSGSISKDCDHKTQDEIFLDTARQHNSTLVTLDVQTLKKPSSASGSCLVVSPYTCLKKFG